MLSFLWGRPFISHKERLRPRNIWNCFGDLCVFSIFMFISFSCMWIFHDFQVLLLLLLLFSPKKRFGMSSNLWYKYGLLVLGSTAYTLKPLNAEGNCFGVIPGTCTTLKTRRGLWEQLTKFWKDGICFLRAFAFHLYSLPTATPVIGRALGRFLL